MALLKILEFPDPKLRQRASEVTVFDSRLKATCEDMLETMYSAKGIGLAAIQVNILKRIVVIDLSEEKNNPLIFINPEIIKISEDTNNMVKVVFQCPVFMKMLQGQVLSLVNIPTWMEKITNWKQMGCFQFVCNTR